MACRVTSTSTSRRDIFNRFGTAISFSCLAVSKTGNINDINAIWLNLRELMVWTVEIIHFGSIFKLSAVNLILGRKNRKKAP